MGMRVSKALINKDYEVKKAILDLFDTKEISASAARKLLVRTQSKMYHVNDEDYDKEGWVDNPMDNRCGCCLKTMELGDPRYPIAGLICYMFPEEWNNGGRESTNPKYKRLQSLIAKSGLVGDICESCFMKLMTEYYGSDKPALSLKAELEARMEYKTWHVTNEKEDDETPDDVVELKTMIKKYVGILQQFFNYNAILANHHKITVYFHGQNKKVDDVKALFPDVELWDLMERFDDLLSFEQKDPALKGFSRVLLDMKEALNKSEIDPAYDLYLERATLYSFLFEQIKRMALMKNGPGIRDLLQLEAPLYKNCHLDKDAYFKQVVDCVKNNTSKLAEVTGVKSDVLFALEIVSRCLVVFSCQRPEELKEIVEQADFDDSSPEMEELKEEFGSEFGKDVIISILESEAFGRGEYVAKFFAYLYNLAMDGKSDKMLTMLDKEDAFYTMDFSWLRRYMMQLDKEFNS